MRKLFKIKPELISVHVPKTAGNSFHEVLKEVYNFRLRYVYKHRELHTWNNGLQYRSNNPVLAAVHGHIEAHPNWRVLYPEAKIVGWIRDPVERVISTYYHWKKKLDHGDKYQKIFQDTDPTLLQFAQMPEFSLTVNALQTYLGRLEPNAYFFIGRTEFFETDLKDLARKMNWKHALIQKKNVNLAKPEIASVEKEKLREALQAEYDLYYRLLQNRKGV